MAPDCGFYGLNLEMAGFIIAQAYCVYNLTFLILNKVNVHIRSLAEQPTSLSYCSFESAG